MGKGSSKGHTPREAKDNLKSSQMLSVIDAISEGPIEGPVDGLKSVLLNSTPVLDSEGNTNISGVTVVFRAGEQEQTPPEGFESSGSETVLGTEVKYDTPITRTITSANIDRLRFTFGVQALVETTSKGDRNPSEVRLLVQIQRNGGWVTEKDITIKGKTTSQYLASVVVGSLPPRPFNIRMRRMTPDSTTDQLQNKTLWSSYTEIIDVKHRGEFVFTKEATSRIGVGNLYRLMRGYATGGYVGTPGSMADSRSQASGTFEQNNHVVINNDGTNGQIGPQALKAVYDMARKGARDEIQAQMRDGGLFSGGGR
ncbi:TipJ family phage tail tip protein [Escherichia coli]|uniref:TipJ family phage tail tip protein n=1 Tax=Escherichia coli TaxID=562 RepID=UPI0039C863D6